MPEYFDIDSYYSYDDDAFDYTEEEQLAEEEYRAWYEGL